MSRGLVNPLFTEWQRLNAQEAPRGARDGPQLERTSIWQARDALVRRYSWAIPSNRAIGRLARLGPLVEIGAGNGYWASLIAAAGGDIIAFDKVPPQTRANGYCDKGTYFNVQQGGPEVLTAFPGRILFLCWPPFRGNMASESLRTFLGDTVVYVGETRAGCTGDEAFFDLLEAEWVLQGRSTLPTWPRIYDGLFIYRRRQRAAYTRTNPARVAGLVGRH